MTASVNGAGEPGFKFSIEIDATSHLPADADRVEALITVTAPSAGMDGQAPRIAEILIMDRSDSMWGQNKIHEALRAACAAIDGLPDGALLGIIAGNHMVEPVFPATGGLAVVDTETRAAARRHVMSLRPEGGTKIGRWLTAASELFAAGSAPDALRPGSAPDALRHAVLYTDGKNEHETRAELDHALSTCAGQFACDVRGLAGDWDYAELEHIADAMHGDATAVLRIADLTDDFTQLMHRIGRAVTPRSYLRLTPDERFRIAAVTQEYPRQADLTGHQQPAGGGGHQQPAGGGHQQPAGGGAVDVPLGAWEEQETRRYRMSLQFEPATFPVEEDLRAVRVDLFAELPGGTRGRCADAPVVVRRHVAPNIETQRKPESLTRIEKERELTMVMRACADAWLDDRFADADAELAVALRLARESGDARLALLAGIAGTGPDGKERVRHGVTHGEMQRLGLHSTKTSFQGISASPASPARLVYEAGGAGGAGPAGPEGGAGPAGEAGGRSAGARTCRACGEVADEAEFRFCEACGTPFDDGNLP